MNRREKLLAGTILALAALLATGYGLRAFFTKPLREVDGRIAALRAKLIQTAKERAGFFQAEDHVKALTRRTFATTPDQASARSGELLTQLILRSGLRETEFTRLPVGPRRLRGALEVGWNVQGDGRLDQVVNLLFLAQSGQEVHRVDNLSILPVESSSGLVRVRFRYVTLVMDPAPEVDAAPLEHAVSLDAPERRVLDGIAQRDIFRPYIKRNPTGPASQNSDPQPSGPLSPAGPENYRVVSLSDWQGQPEVHIRDLANQQTLRFKPGDSLAGGTIVLVDYRSLPSPDANGLHSSSRVILRIGLEYWAVERGRTLAQRYRLTPDQLPQSLAQAASLGSAPSKN